jgi:hypothetical protein
LLLLLFFLSKNISKQTEQMIVINFVEQQFGRHVKRGAEAGVRARQRRLDLKKEEKEKQIKRKRKICEPALVRNQRARRSSSARRDSSPASDRDAQSGVSWKQKDLKRERFENKKIWNPNKTTRDEKSTCPCSQLSPLAMSRPKLIFRAKDNVSGECKIDDKDPRGM